MTQTPSMRLRIARAVQRLAFTTSGEYWERRYAQGGTSGAGSYGDMAQWKADRINLFVSERGIKRVMEFGCGDGNQLALAEYPQYFGVDVSKTAVDLCRTRFADDPSKSFAWIDPERWCNNGFVQADLVLSLDVILHLVEDERLAQHLRAIDSAGTRFAIFVTEDGKTSPGDPHVRYRNVADWSKMLPDWECLQVIRNPYKLGHPSDADMFVFQRRDRD